MGGGCYYSAELGWFPIWDFDCPLGNKSRPQVRVLNSGVCIEYAGLSVEVFEYASRFYHSSFDMNEHLISNYGISQKVIK